MHERNRRPLVFRLALPHGRHSHDATLRGDGRVWVIAIRVCRTASRAKKTQRMPVPGIQTPGRERTSSLSCTTRIRCLIMAGSSEPSSIQGAAGELRAFDDTDRVREVLTTSKKRPRQRDDQPRTVGAETDVHPCGSRRGSSCSGREISGERHHPAGSPSH
jgi:hypothetical protein